jgi:Tfp pilus assembly PilM family ATPase
MTWFGRTLVGAYVCPRGVYLIECKSARGGVEVARILEVPLEVDTASDAADHLVNILRAAGFQRPQIAVAVRGFGVAHHLLQMPPANDDVLAPIVEREVRRLEPQLGDSVVSWIPLPALKGAGAETAGQRSLLAAAMPSDVAATFETRLRSAGFTLLHLTALPAAMQRLVEEFEPDSKAMALVAPLPDAGFLGFVLDGAIRLVVEPPLPEAAQHEVPALAEEVQLGVTFVRQQFRGVQIERITLAGSQASHGEAEFVLTERLGIPTERIGIAELPPAALAALGAVIDSRSAVPLSFGGSTRRGGKRGASSTIESLSVAAVVLVILLAAWATFEAGRANRAAAAVRAARVRIERDSFGLGPIRTTADQRRLVQDALGALRLVVTDRVELQQALAGIAQAIRSPVQLDSLRLSRAADGWSAIVGGSVAGGSNAEAVQSLYDLYREIPQRLSVESLSLDHLTYPEGDAADEGTAVVRFQMSFGLPSPRKG